MTLAEVIRRALDAERETPVEAQLFGTGDAARIAARVEAFCARALGRSVTGGRFWRTSVGCVAGVELPGP